MTTEFLHQSRKSWGQHDLNDIFLDIYIGFAEDASSEKHNDKYGTDLSGLVHDIAGHGQTQELYMTILQSKNIVCWCLF